jgi:hypothetical protein
LECVAKNQIRLADQIRQGKPLDDITAMEALRRGEYEKNAEEYAWTYKVPVGRVKLWMAHGWPLDNQEAVKRFLDHQQMVAAHPRANRRPKVVDLAGHPGVLFEHSLGTSKIA